MRQVITVKRLIASVRGREVTQTVRLSARLVELPWAQAGCVSGTILLKWTLKPREGSHLRGEPVCCYWTTDGRFMLESNAHAWRAPLVPSWAIEAIRELSLSKVKTFQGGTKWMQGVLRFAQLHGIKV